MSKHMLDTLRRLADGGTCGFHYGTLKALVGRGLAETYISKYGTEYKISDAGRDLVAAEGRA